MEHTRNLKNVLALVGSSFLILFFVNVIWTIYSIYYPLQSSGYFAWILSFAVRSSGILAVAAASLFDVIKDEKHWWKLTKISAASVAFIILAEGLMLHGQRGYSVLYRDIFASVVLVVAFTFLASWLAKYANKRGIPPIVGAISLVVLTIPSAIFLFISILFVHCTSGDCL